MDQVVKRVSVIFYWESRFWTCKGRAGHITKHAICDYLEFMGLMIPGIKSGKGDYSDQDYENETSDKGRMAGDLSDIVIENNHHLRWEGIAIPFHSDLHHHLVQPFLGDRESEGYLVDRSRRIIHGRERSGGHLSEGDGGQ